MWTDFSFKLGGEVQWAYTREEALQFIRSGALTDSTMVSAVIDGTNQLVRMDASPWRDLLKAAKRERRSAETHQATTTHAPQTAAASGHLGQPESVSGNADQATESSSSINDQWGNRQQANASGREANHRVNHQVFDEIKSKGHLIDEILSGRIFLKFGRDIKENPVVGGILSIIIVLSLTAAGFVAARVMDQGGTVRNPIHAESGRGFTVAGSVACINLVEACPAAASTALAAGTELTWQELPDRGDFRRILEPAAVRHRYILTANLAQLRPRPTILPPNTDSNNVATLIGANSATATSQQNDDTGRAVTPRQRRDSARARAPSAARAAPARRDRSDSGWPDENRLDRSTSVF